MLIGLTSATTWDLVPVWRPRARTTLLGRVEEDGLVSVSLDMLLEILWALERLLAELAFVRLEWDVSMEHQSA